MYLRPKGLERTLQWERRDQDSAGERGRVRAQWQAAGEVTGVLADASPQERLRFIQLQHPITHTFVVRGTVEVEPGDRLVHGDRQLYVVSVEDAGGQGLWTLVRLEERSE